MLQKTLTGVLLLVIMLGSESLACTIFSAADEQNVLFGNNEDWSFTDPIIAFLPADARTFGRMVLGWRSYYPNYPQGGLNTEGLSLDWATTPTQNFMADPRKADLKEPLLTKLLKECATVAQAIQLVMAYNCPQFQNEHLLVADRSGNSAIIEWGDTGLVAIKKQRYYQLVTNFNTTNPATGWYPCQRYNTAQALLENNAAGVSVNLIKTILQATHQEGQDPTIYSTIYDLKNLTITVFYQHNFAQSITLDLKAELYKGEHLLELKNVFNE